MQIEHGKQITASALMTEVIESANTKYDEPYETALIGETFDLVRGYYGQYDVRGAMVVCSGDVPENMVLSADETQTSIFGKSILNPQQMAEGLKEFMKIPAGFHLQLRHAESQQRAHGINPEQAACKRKKVAVGGLVPARPSIQ